MRSPRSSRTPQQVPQSPPTMTTTDEEQARAFSSPLPLKLTQRQQQTPRTAQRTPPTSPPPDHLFARRLPYMTDDQRKIRSSIDSPRS
jgi:hypothetical protein